MKLSNESPTDWHPVDLVSLSWWFSLVDQSPPWTTGCDCCVLRTRLPCMLLAWVGAVFPAKVRCCGCTEKMPWSCCSWVGHFVVLKRGCKHALNRDRWAEDLNEKKTIYHTFSNYVHTNTFSKKPLQNFTPTLAFSHRFRPSTLKRKNRFLIDGALCKM